MNLKLKNAIKLQKELVNELKQNKKQIISVYNNEELAKEDKDARVNELLIRQYSLSNDLVNLKTNIRLKNDEINITRKIYELTELKQIESIYRYINSKEEADKLKGTINKIENILEEVNTSEEVEVEIESQIIEKIEQKN